LTWVEYGKLNVNMFQGSPRLTIDCTMPEKLLKTLAKINDYSLKMEVHKDNRVFVDIPNRYL